MEPRKSVLIVDDEPSIRESLRQILKPYYEVHMAADGKEALQWVQRQAIDVVTLDLKMPGMSGIEVLREIKKFKEGIEVIIITAYGDADNASEALYHGAADLIAKPFDISEVTTKVSQSLERRYHGLKIKDLIQHIKHLLPQRDEGKEERLLVLSKNLCEMLVKVESSNPAGTEEARESTSPPLRPLKNKAPTEKMTS